MTSTLPNFAAAPATPVAPPSLGSPVGSTAGALTGEPPAGSPEAPVDFSQLLSAAPGEPSPVAVAILPLPTLPAGGADAVTAIAFAAPPPRLSAATLAAGEETIQPRAITREELESAAAFLANVLQALQPPVATLPVDAAMAAPVPTSGVAGTPVPSTVAAPLTAPVAMPGSLPMQPGPTSARAGRGEAPRTPAPSTGLPSTPSLPDSSPAVAPEEAPAPTSLPLGDPISSVPAADVATVWTGDSVASVTARPVQPDRFATPLPPDLPIDRLRGPVLSKAPASVAPAVAAPAGELTPASEPEFVLAADGAITCRLAPPTDKEWSPSLGVAAEPVLEVSAELELPGQAVIRIETAFAPPADPSAEMRPVKFAGWPVAEKKGVDSATESFERNFVFTGREEVKPESIGDGIRVAKTEGTMPAALHEEIRAAQPTNHGSVFAVRPDFQVSPQPAERLAVAPAEAAQQNFAERAVATVTGLAEAQFSATMQRSGSVQLRLKFGGEDLSVRVELRDGVVHTDFRTDSPELRRVIAQEWSAVAAASPGHLQRFLDPVFSPATPAAGADAGAQSGQHRAPSQQQAQEQAAQRQEAWNGGSPFARRSALSASFVPEPAAPRGPAFLPTSLRLSVLA